jgi:hypothetical protein
MNKEDFLKLPLAAKQAVYALHKKTIDKLFFAGQHYNIEKNPNRTWTLRK